MNKISILFLMAISTVGCANEKSRMDHAGSQRMGPPPQEALDVCQNKAQDSACKVTSPRGDSLAGLCKTTPDNQYFACMPERPKH